MSDTHVEVGKTSTIEARFYADGVLADDGTPTIGITKADGTVLVAPLTATTSGGTGIRRYALAAQSEVNLLTATWTGATQTVVTRVEVIGALLFTLNAFRALRVAGSEPFSSSATPLFSDQQILDARAQTLDEFERILGYSPVPRFARETLDGDGGASLVVPHRRCQRLLSVTVNGAAQSLAGYTLRWSGVLEATSSYQLAGRFTDGRYNVVAEYVHGEPRVPGRGGNIAQIAAANILMPGFGSTARSVVTADGTAYDLGDPAGQVTASGRVREYGIPVIDGWLNRWLDSVPA